MPGAATTTNAGDATDAQGSRGQRGTVTNGAAAARRRAGVGRTRGIVVLRPTGRRPARRERVPAGRAPGIDINMLRALAAALEETKNSAPTPPWSVSLTTSHLSEKVTAQIGVSATLYHPWEVNKYQAYWAATPTATSPSASTG